MTFAKLHPRSWFDRFAAGLRTGPFTRYYRDIVRPRILRAPSAYAAQNADLEVHVLTSAADWLNALWAIRSLLRVWPEPLSVVLHDDGSLSPEHIAALRASVPGSRFIPRAQADAEVDVSLNAHPACQAFRRSNPLAAKLFDFRHYLATDTMLLLDSDVLFFFPPHALIEAASAHPQRNVFNAGQRSMYTIPPDELSRLTGLDVPKRVNSGLGIVHRESLSLDWIEEFLQLPGILSHWWRTEQTLYTLCGARFGMTLLPTEYDVTLGRHATPGAPSRHYVGPIRNLFYREGIARLAAPLLAPRQ